MPLHEELVRSGALLFRWRSYLPFVFLPLVLIAVMRYPEIESNLELHFAWSMLSLAVALTGLFIRCHTVGHAPEGTSGRNTKRQIAETLNTTGFYSIVRHPLYLGNYLIAFGIVLHSLSPWLIGLFVTSFALYYERIMFTEEAFLRQKFGRSFVNWASQTPAFLPRLGNWTKAEHPMDGAKIIRQESAAVAVIVLAFTGLELAVHASQSGIVNVELSWYYILAAGALIYVVARIMKRQLRRWTKYEAILTRAAK